MKAELLIATLLVAFAQAKYELSCAKSELSIRWPSYDSNSEYYVCSRLFGRQMTVTCNPGEVFTFVLQSCTNPSRYIPAPDLEVLPTASPLFSKPNEDGYLTPVEIPDHPPVLGPPVVEIPVTETTISHPPIKPATIPLAPAIVVDTPKVEETEYLQKEENVPIVEEPVKILAPLPPTPAPTPPVVEKDISKKPSAGPSKKPNAKKKKSTASNSAAGNKPGKKPSKASSKKPAAKKNAKQSSKSPKTPKKSVKKTKATDKKSPKA